MPATKKIRCDCGGAVSVERTLPSQFIGNTYVFAVRERVCNECSARPITAEVHVFDITKKGVE